MEKMLRGERCICMFAPSADGGHARYVKELLTAMSQQAGDELRLELATSEDLDKRFRSDAYRISAFLPPLRHRESFPNRLAWVAARVTHYPRREREFLRWLAERPDIAAVHFQEWTPWLAARLFRRIQRMGKRVYYTVHNIVPHKYPAVVPRWLMNRWIRRACRRADGLFVHTEQLARELSRFLGDPHPGIYVSPHGIWNVNDFDRGAALEQRMSWKRLLFFGAIRRNKGLDLLLRAAPLLSDFTITIAGEPLDSRYFDSEILPQVKQLQAAGVKIDLRAQFLPEDQLGPLFASHSAIVLPYTQQFVAQSGVVFLALAYELPVVVSEVGGLRELMQQFDIGTTFRSATPEALAAAVRCLWSEHHPHRLLSQMRAARARYSWSAAAEATLRAYGFQKEMETTANARPFATTAAL